MSVEAAAGPRDQGAEDSRPRTGGSRILVVEDNADVRETTIDRVVALGHQVVACDGADAAIAILKARADVDLVFSDVVMAGGMSGLDLAAWIADNRPGVPVLLTSGFTAELIQKRSSGGVTPPLLRKPYASAIWRRPSPGRSRPPAAERPVLSWIKAFLRTML